MAQFSTKTTKYILANSLMVLKRVWVFNYGKTVLFMLDSGFEINATAKEFWFTTMETSTKVSGSIIMLMAMESSMAQMVLFTKVIGKMTFRKEPGRKFGKKELNMRESLLKAQNKAKESIPLPQEIFTLENLSRTD